VGAAARCRVAVGVAVESGSALLATARGEGGSADPVSAAWGAVVSVGLRSGPSAVLKVTAGGGAVKISRSGRSRASSGAPGVRRDVSGALEAAVVAVGGLLCVLGVVERQLVHVELVGHDRGGSMKEDGEVSVRMKNGRGAKEKTVTSLNEPLITSEVSLGGRKLDDSSGTECAGGKCQRTPTKTE